MASRLMWRGRCSEQEGVIHLMATRIVDRTAMLDTLGDGREIRPTSARAGSDASATAAGPCGIHGHPRDVRILPKSRDFH